MMGEACLPIHAYYPRTPDYTLYSGVHDCWSEHSDSSFVYGFMNFYHDHYYYLLSMYILERHQDSQFVENCIKTFQSHQKLQQFEKKAYLFYS